MKKFEYKVLRANTGVFRGIEYSKLNDQLNQLGIVGWEVVAMVSLTNAGGTASLLTTLKRELPG